MAKKLFFRRPAAGWNEALPIGNGFIGGMVCGDTETEKIFLNEDSVWYGGRQERENPDAIKHLAEIRQLILAGNQLQAEELALAALTGVPDNQRHYDVAGDLELRLGHAFTEVENYERQLDFSGGLAAVSYNYRGAVYTREYFVSYPDRVMAIELTTDNPAGMDFRCRLVRGRGLVDEVKICRDSATVLMESSTSKDSLLFQVALSVDSDGEIGQLGEYLTVKGAQKTVLLVSIATGFRDEDLTCTNRKRLRQARQKGFKKLRQAHCADVSQLFERVDFCCGESRDEAVTTAEQWESVRAGEEKYVTSLMETLFHFGRYLLIACSRAGSLPANLQGIWNKDFLPPWDAKYTVNINTEMNYWPAEKANLAECHQPLFDHLERMYPQGRRTAQKMYGARGFVCHHNTDIYGDCGPQGAAVTATFWPMGAAWLVLHVFEHYRYSSNREFLARYFYLLEEAAVFFLDYLQELPGGWRGTLPSVSPENRFFNERGEKCALTAAPTMDNQLLRDLFQAYLEAAAILDQGSSRTEVQEALLRLPPDRIGNQGQLQEWFSDYEDVDPGHRHISHLYGVFPSNQITPEHKALFQAAKITLERRLANGGGHTGWSCAWIINLYARLQDGEGVYQNARRLLQHSTLPNLLDDHPPFQIDGNFGYVSGVIEAIVQKRGQTIFLLPALPKEWSSGYLTGIRLPDNVTISIRWQENEIKEVRLTGPVDSFATVVCKNTRFDREQLLQDPRFHLVVPITAD